MIVVKTKDFDTTQLYPVDAMVFIKNGLFTTSEGYCSLIPFGCVVTSPSSKHPKLEVEVYTDIFEIKFPRKS